MKRVVVTGIGAVTPLGNSFQHSWESAMAGLSGIRAIEKFDASKIRWKVAGELRGFDPGIYLSQKEINHLDPFIWYAVAASIMAVEDAGLIQQKSGVRSQELRVKDSKLRTPNSELSLGGVIIGSSRGGISMIEKSIANSHRLRISPYLMPSSTVSAAASYVAQKIGLKGYCLGISNACASGSNAIGEAYRLIKNGFSGPVLSGGAEAPVCRLCIEGYGMSGALSGANDCSASRPFDISRDGFVLSEGACVLVLEDYEEALRRGAKVYGEIIGYGNTADAFHPTRPSSEGQARAIISALNEAGVSTEDVDYINAHATSTPLGDKSEADAIKLVFGKRGRSIPVSSIKSMTGHMLSASGAFEAAVTLMCLKEGLITPTINLKQQDPECGLNCITEIREAGLRTAISNSFGFGGVNAVLVFKRA